MLQTGASCGPQLVQRCRAVAPLHVAVQVVQAAASGAAVLAPELLPAEAVHRARVTVTVVFPDETRAALGADELCNMRGSLSPAAGRAGSSRGRADVAGRRRLARRVECDGRRFKMLNQPNNESWL